MYLLSRGNISSTHAVICVRGAIVPSILYRLSTAMNTLVSPFFRSSRLSRSLVRARRSPETGLWGKARSNSGVSLDRRMPSCTEAWICASYNTTSPGCGTAEKKPTFTSNPELKSRAVSAPENQQSRASSSTWGCDGTSRREPPDQRMCGDVAWAVRTAVRKVDEVARER